MKSLFIFLLIGTQLCFSNDLIWSKTGHRVTGEIAEMYLSRRAKKKIYGILDGQSLAEVSNFADDIKSDPAYSSYSPWHYVNYPGHLNYGDETPSSQGDIVMAIEKCIAVLEDDSSSLSDQAFYLKMLVHFLGDLHQPMHVGRAEDRGGNDIQLQWFNEGTNLHRVWDFHMIDDFGMSYTELADKLPKLSKRSARNMQEGTVYDWVEETQVITNEVYAAVEVGEQLRYAYSYKYWGTVEGQLLKGGVRLAGILNRIFG